MALFVMTPFILRPGVADEKGGTELSRRTFEVMPTFAEKVSEAMEEMGKPSGKRDLKEFFGEMGVSWPEGSSARFIPSIGRLDVVNTPDNLLKCEEILNWASVIPCQIEITAQFVEYDLADVDVLSKEGRVEQDALKSLWQKGKARLLYTPTVVTQSGAEGTAKGVREIIYPTEFTVTPLTSETNGTTIIYGTITEPGSFETRDVGASLQVLAEVNSDGSWINLTMTPIVVYEPEWKDYSEKSAGSKGKGDSTKIEVPFFHSQTVTTSISVKDGATVLMGGGMPSKDPTKVVYTFVTARRIGLDGKPLKTPVASPAK